MSDQNNNSDKNNRKRFLKLLGLISAAIAAGYRLMEELGQKPRVYYLPPKNRPVPVPEESAGSSEKNT